MLFISAWFFPDFHWCFLLFLLFVLADSISSTSSIMFIHHNNKLDRGNFLLSLNSVGYIKLNIFSGTWKILSLNITWLNSNSSITITSVSMQFDLIYVFVHQAPFRLWDGGLDETNMMENALLGSRLARNPNTHHWVPVSSHSWTIPDSIVVVCTNYWSTKYGILFLHTMWCVVGHLDLPHCEVCNQEFWGLVFYEHWVWILEIGHLLSKTSRYMV